MIAMSFPKMVEEMGGLTVPMAPVVVLTHNERGEISTLTKLTGGIREMKINGQWVLALDAEPVRTKTTLDL